MKIENNQIYNIDCLDEMKYIEDNSIDMVLTDIPYNEVNRKGKLRNLDKETANILTFDITDFLNEIYRITKGSVCIFCGREQFSEIYKFFTDKKGTTRPIIWEKANPSPMNGQYICLSGVELAVWFKKSGATFNAYCKNTVFKYPNGARKLHPTQKNLELFKELILDNTNMNNVILDPCIGSGTTAIAALNTGRQYIGFELNKDYYNIAIDRINKIKQCI